MGLQWGRKDLHNNPPGSPQRMWWPCTFLLISPATSLLGYLDLWWILPKGQGMMETEELHFSQHTRHITNLINWLIKSYHGIILYGNLKHHRNLRNSQYEIGMVRQLFLMTLWLSLVSFGHLVSSDWLGIEYNIFHLILPCILFFNKLFFFFHELR